MREIGVPLVAVLSAVRWRGMPLGELEGQVALGKLEPVQIESRVFIELDTLKAFDVSKYPARRSR